jgi:hypothetical protein
VSTPSIKELRQARAREGQRSPKWLRWLYVAAGLFVLYVVIGFFVAPSIVRSQLEKRLSAELKRDVRVEKVVLNPLTLSGAIEGFAIREKDGKGDFVSWKRAFANVDSWSLLTGGITFDELLLDGAYARVAVDRAGKLNFADLLALVSESKPVEGKASEPIELRVRRLEVSGAKLDYAEDMETGAFATTVGPVSFLLKDFHTGGKNNAPGEFSATTESGETIGWRGTVAVSPLRSGGEFSLGNIVLKKYMPYVGRVAKFAITDGMLAVKGKYELLFAQEKPALRMSEGVVSLKGFKLGAPGAAEPAVALDSLVITGLAADSAANAASVGKVALNGGRIVVTRDAEGIDLLKLVEPKIGASVAAPQAGTGAGAAGVGLPDARLGELAVTGLTVIVNDTTPRRPARLDLEQISLNVKDVSLLQLAKASPLEMSALLKGGGSIKVSGSLAPQPLKGEIMLDVENVPLSVVSPYVEMFAHVRIAQGAASAKARVSVDTPVAGGLPAVTAHADASVSDFQAIEGEGPEELARWKTLALRGIEAVTSPSLKLLVADIEWTDPVGSVVVGEDGRINLMDLMVKPAGAAQPPASVPGVSFKKAGASPSVPAGAMQSTTFIAIDRFQLNNAAFTFTDRSMEPDVTMAINQLSGTVSGLSSANLARADVDIKGRVNGVAPISIRGQINPLASEAFTDVKVDFRSIDLMLTSPYVGKFAGYQLTKGALTLDVRAKLNQNKLDTSNVVTLDQFTLGEKVESPDATKLPVGLALALLRDRRGQIVLDVPVQGRLDDPEFKVGRVVMRVIGNILTKAATSPFALLGSMFGGGAKSEQLAFQTFEPGTAELTPDSIQKLDVVAKALTERPGLRLDISGAYGVAADSPALRERELDKGLRAALWEEMRRSAMGAAVPPLEQIEVSPEAAERLTKVFYRAAFESEAEESAETGDASKPEEAAAVEKPGKKSVAAPVRMFRRGGAPVPTASRPAAPKAPPPRPYSVVTAGTPDGPQAGGAQPAGPTLEEMRAKLMAAIVIDGNTLRALAAERAERVRSYLVENGQIEAERISLTAGTPKGARVDLQLK